MAKQILPLDLAIVAASTICKVLDQKPLFNNKLKNGRTIKWYYAERKDVVKAHKALKKAGISTEVTESHHHYAPVFGIKFTTVDDFSIRKHCPTVNSPAKTEALSVDQQIDMLTRDQLVHALKNCKMSTDTLIKRLK